MLGRNQWGVNFWRVGIKVVSRTLVSAYLVCRCSLLEILALEYYWAEARGELSLSRNQWGVNFWQVGIKVVSLTLARPVHYSLSL